MSNAAAGIVDSMKQIAENYVNYRNLSDLLVGVYDGKVIIVNGTLPVPVEMIRNRSLLLRLSKGTGVKLMRKEGGKEYYLMEILD